MGVWGSDYDSGVFHILSTYGGRWRPQRATQGLHRHVEIALGHAGMCNIGVMPGKRVLGAL